MSVIETNNLQKRYQVGENSVHAVDGVDLNIREGEFVCISGRSGSGKSTLLSLLAGLESPTDGEVILMGEHLEQMNEQERGRFRRDHIGFIFQVYRWNNGGKKPWKHWKWLGFVIMPNTGPQSCPEDSSSVSVLPEPSSQDQALSLLMSLPETWTAGPVQRS